MNPFVLAAEMLALQREQWRPSHVVRERQWRLLRSMLAHAYDTTPHYRSAFDARGITPADIRTPDDLTRLPILKKRDLRAPDGLFARGYKRESLHKSFSSGSTGEGATTYFDDRAWVIGRFLVKLRARLACGLRPWHNAALFQWIPNEPSFLRRRILRQLAFGVHEPLDQTTDSLVSFGPHALYGFPSYLTRLAPVAAGRVRPRFVFTSGELLTERVRETIASGFGAEVFDIYGCTEMKEIAWECPARSGYHVNADSVFVEILTQEEDGVPAGSIVVTSLVNRAMPLIRYLVGDSGSWIPEACSCGRGLPLMRPSLGRLADYFILPGGGEVSPYNVMDPVEALPGVAQFEIVQDRTDHALVRVVPSATFDEDTKREIVRGLAPVIPGMTITIEVVDEIRPEKSGKFRIVKNTAFSDS